MRLFFFTFLLFFVITAYSQNKQEIEKSDSLFAKGVKLYKSGKYKDAIPLFTESDRIDKDLLDSTNNRRDYSAIWLASCYYHLGDSVQAAFIHPNYRIKPIDRRMTVKSDSLSDLGATYYHMGDYSAALASFKKCAEIEKSVAGESHIWYGNSILSISACYQSLKDTAKALSTKQIYTDIVKSCYGEMSKENLDAVYNLGNLYALYSFHEKALSIFSSGYDIAQIVDYGQEAFAYKIAQEYNATGGMFSGEKEREFYKKALSYLDKADLTDSQVIELQKKVRLNIAASFFIEAHTNGNIGNYSEAIRLCTETLNIIAKELGSENADYALALSNLASYNSSLGNYSEAIRLGTKALNIQAKVLGTAHSSYATSLSNLASYNSSLGNYSEAIRLGTEALNLFSKALGTEHPDYATLLSNLANYNASSGNYSEAIHLETEALNIRKKVLGTEHPDYAVSLNNLANYNSSLGNYSEAIRLGTEALNIRKKVLGTKHPVYATSLNNLATYNSYLGNYPEAIRLGTEALNIQAKVLGTEHAGYATSLSNLAAYNSYLSNYPEAIRLSTEALNIRAKVLGTEHPYYAVSLSSLANYNSSLGNYSEAIRLGTDALNIFSKTLGTEHPYYAIALDKLADYNASSGNYSEAVRLETIALKICQKQFGKEHPNYAILLDNLARYNCCYSGSYSEAARLSKEILNIYEKVYGKQHAYYITMLGNSVFYNIATNNLSKVNQDIVECTNLLSSLIKNTFVNLTAYERRMFWNTHKIWLENYIHNFAYKIRNDTLSANGYNSALMSKGLLLNSDIEFSTLVQESGDKKSITLYNELYSLRKQIDALREKPITERPVNLDSLERIANNKEHELLRYSKLYGDYTHNLVIDWKQILEKIDTKDVVVEFVSFPSVKDSIMYIAYILRKDMKTPQMIPLFEEKKLKSIRLQDYYTSDAVSDLVWQPLKEYIKDSENVYFSPSGELYNIAIESVPSSIISNKKLYRLSSTRELVLKKSDGKQDNAAIYGGLQYDLKNIIPVVDNNRNFEKNVTNDFTSYYNIADSLDAYRDASSLPKYLPPTKIEAEDIEKALKSSAIKTKLYTDTTGTETSFKALSGKHIDIIHIATHGFYWKEHEIKTTDFQIKPLQSNLLGRYTEDKAMARSGLLFAGANTALKGEKLPIYVDDGILTAKEIASLDLRSLDLVVLSACQTGLGEITGDGVFGLQRGFKKAGANTLMMSLWKVDDNATQILMTQFYKGIIAGKSKFEALRNAQQYVREFEVEKVVSTNMGKRPLSAHAREQAQQNMEKKVIKKVKPYQNPKYWAAFILLDAIK